MASPSISKPFPGRVLSAGSNGPDVVAIQQRLNTMGCGPIATDGAFGVQTAEAVQLFQARSQDQFGNSLQIDGRVGPTTWAALFGNSAVPSVATATSPVRAKVLEVAAAEVGTMEDPLGSNRGPKVDQYLRAAGLDPATGSYPWCAAFVYWCFQNAAAQLSVPNPAIKTASVHTLWAEAGAKGIDRISPEEVAQQPSLVEPGVVFVITTSATTGHVGFVKQVDGVILTTIEGNTNLGGSREGIGVFLRKSRHVDSINCGFVKY